MHLASLMGVSPETFCVYNFSVTLLRNTDIAATHRFGKVRYPNSAASVGTFFRQCRHVSKCRHCRQKLSASVGMSAETVGKMADTSCVEFVSHIRSAEKTQRMPTLPTIVGKNLPTLPTSVGQICRHLRHVGLSA